MPCCARRGWPEILVAGSGFPDFVFIKILVMHDAHGVCRCRMKEAMAITATLRKFGIIFSLASFFLYYEEVFRFIPSRFLKKQLCNTAKRGT